MTLPSAFVTATVDGDPVAVARAVADTGWVGVFGLATLPTARRRGAAGRVLATVRFRDAFGRHHVGH